MTTPSKENLEAASAVYFICAETHIRQSHPCDDCIAEALQAKDNAAKGLVKALIVAQEAIFDAIANEDGLDGAEGKRVMRQIEEALEKYRKENQ